MANELVSVLARIEVNKVFKAYEAHDAEQLAKKWLNKFGSSFEKKYGGRVDSRRVELI